MNRYHEYLLPDSAVLTSPRGGTIRRAAARRAGPAGLALPAGIGEKMSRVAPKDMRHARPVPLARRPRAGSSPMSGFLILGAGMAGVGTALALQEQGHDVVLVDRREPGRETSHGNAGVIQAEAVEPYALPRAPMDLLRIALRRGNDVRYHLDALPGQAVALWHYWRASRPDRHRAVSADYARMIRRATADHAALIAAAGVEGLIRRDGLFQIYRDPRLLAAAAREAARLSGEYGIGVEVLDAAGLASAEPALRAGLAGAVRWADSWNCSDPGALVAAYARLFQTRGGIVATGDAATLRPTGAGWTVDTADGPVNAGQAVVALGPWSPDLLRRFGYRFRMVLKRGYHRHFVNAGGLRITLHDPDHGMVLAPMAAGVRVTTGAELARESAPATPRQLERAAAEAGRLIPLGPPVEAGPWMGRRPCLPGMLPFVGRLPRHPTLWGNFGHGHQGFTLGPTTGRMLADQVMRPAV